jgi:MFS family permease
MSGHPSFVLQKRLIAIVAIGLFADYFLLSVVIPILPHALHAVGYGEREIGFLFSAKPGAQILCNLIIGPIVDRRGPRVVLLATTLVLAASTGLFAFGLAQTHASPSAAYGICMVARAIQGMASSGIMSGGMALIAENHDESIHGSAMGMAVSGIAAGVVLGPPIGGLLAYYSNNLVPFFIVIVVVCMDALGQVVYNMGQNGRWFAARNMSMNGGNEGMRVVTSELLRPMSPDSHDESGSVDSPKSCCSSISVFSLLSNRRIAVVAMGNLCSNFCVGMMEVILPLFLIKWYQYSQLAIGLVFFAMSMSYLVATPLSGALSDHVNKSKIFGCGLLLAGVGLISFFWSAHAVIIWTICSLILTGVGIAFVDTPSMALLSSIAAEDGIEDLGSVFALQDLSVCIGFMLGPFVGTHLQASAGFQNTCLAAGILLLAYAPSTYFFKSVEVRQGSDYYPASEVAADGH